MPPKKKSKRGRSKSPKRCPKGCTKVKKTKRGKSPKKTKRRKSPKKTKRRTSPKKTKRSKSPKKTKRSKSPKKTTKRAKVMRDTFTMSQLKQINAAGGGTSQAGDTKASLARRIAKSPASWAVAAALLVGGGLAARKLYRKPKPVHARAGEAVGSVRKSTLTAAQKRRFREMLPAVLMRKSKDCKYGRLNPRKCGEPDPCYYEDSPYGPGCYTNLGKRGGPPALPCDIKLGDNVEAKGYSGIGIVTKMIVSQGVLKAYVKWQYDRDGYIYCKHLRRVKRGPLFAPDLFKKAHPLDYTDPRTVKFYIEGLRELAIPALNSLYSQTGPRSRERALVVAELRKRGIQRT
uniref:Uncharacterized protein n=1 Tax=viral metagenome TaxID=1070528 RepID=A0A6C0BRN9_9ZZZZ